MLCLVVNSWCAGKSGRRQHKRPGALLQHNKQDPRRSDVQSMGMPKMLKTLLQDEATAGKLIILFAALALVFVNSPFRDVFENFWHIDIRVGFGDASISQDIRHWVNEALMAFFFLAVGLEIKRELVGGELKDPRKAALPIAAAAGGMIFPAIIYLVFNLNPETIQGWGVPIATDIAFAVAVLSLLGKRVPLSLKIFLLTLAIVDDIGAITVIALFYAEIINYGFLLASAGIVATLLLFRKWLSGRLLVFCVIGIVLWVTTHLSGIHASIVGAILGLLASTSALPGLSSNNKRLEVFSLPISTFIALPIFALANAGVVFTLAVFDQPYALSVMIGIVAGLIIGKFVGISLAAWLMVRFGIAKLPADVNWYQIIGVSFIAGIGFTVSIFITELAFSNQPELAHLAKLSIFFASGVAALVGSIVLSIAATRRLRR